MDNHFFTRRAIVVLMVWASCAIGLCGEIDDAARTGDLAKVKALLKENPALVSSTFFDGWMPLHEAADNGYFAMAKVLVANGADLDVRAKGGRSPLYLATMYDHRDIVRLLLAHGASANVKDDDSVTPLHLAAWSGYEDVAKLLLAHGADVNAKDAHGRTPMDWATERGDKSMEKLLMKAMGKE
jgi:ankyrin repeat protein